MKILEWIQYFNENLLLPIVLSIIAAIIFWLAFNYLPTRWKYKKIRPKVEFDLYQMHLDLSFYFFKLFKISPHRSVENQHTINAGCLTKNEINLWLQDKCLNETYKYDENKTKLISIGEELERIALKYSERLQKLLNFVDYLSVDEILLLQKIEYKLFTYDYRNNSESIIGNKKLQPLIPNIAYMTENIYEIYQLYLALRKIIIEFKLIDKNINKYILQNLNSSKAEDYYNRGDYKKCLRYVNRKLKKENTWLVFQCQLKLGNEATAYKKLREILSSSTLELVSLRGYLSPFILENNKVISICKELRSEGELKYCLKIISEEIALKEYYKKQNEELKQYYESKLNKEIAHGREEYEKMKKSL